MSVTHYDPIQIFERLDASDDRYKLAAGNNLKAGRLLKLDGGKLAPCDAGDTPHSILLRDTDATSMDTATGYGLAGVVVEDGVDFGTGAADDFREALRAVGIYLTKGV